MIRRNITISSFVQEIFAEAEGRTGYAAPVFDEVNAGVGIEVEDHDDTDAQVPYLFICPEESERVDGSPMDFSYEALRGINQRIDWCEENDHDPTRLRRSLNQQLLASRAKSFDKAMRIDEIPNKFAHTKWALTKMVWEMQEQAAVA